MSTERESQRYQLLAVFERPEQVQQVIQDLRSIGVGASLTEVDTDRDRVAALKGEMREELTEGWILPQAAVAWTKEGTKGLVLITVVASIVGALVAAPFAFIDFGLTFLGRLILLVLIGLVVGGTLGLVLGPALASKRPDEPMAAQRGPVLRVEVDSPEVRQVLASHRPIRIDQVKGDVPIDTVVTEEANRPGGTAQDIDANAKGDDYQAP
jgi:hypothetical protein